jgi:predicted aconitase with swiveling domain
VDERTVLHGRTIVGGRAEGSAIVTHEPICFLGGVDVETGDITERGHHLLGQSIAGKILVFPTGKGSTGGSYLIYEAARNGVGPLAIVNVRAEQVTVIGCVIAEIPMVAECDRDPTQVIETGDHVVVDADAGTVVVEKGGRDHDRR